MEHLIGQVVEVVTDETVYKGVLKAVEVNEIHLQTESAWIAVPVWKIVEVREAG